MYKCEDSVTAQAVAEALGVSEKEAARYADMSEGELKKLMAVRLDGLWNIASYNVAYKMFKDQWKPSVVTSYIKSLGIFNGSDSTLRNHVNLIGKMNFPELFKEEKRVKKHNKKKDGLKKLPRSKISSYPTKLEPSEREMKTRNELVEKCPACKKIREIFLDFHQAIMGKDVANLDSFLEKHESSLPGFCESLKKNRPAIVQAVTSPYSSGIVEGNNTKFKLVKRIVYGRSKLVNLETKFLLYCRFESGHYSVPACSL